MKRPANRIILTCLLTLILIPALACNLPERHTAELSFPIDLTQVPAGDQPVQADDQPLNNTVILNPAMPNLEPSSSQASIPFTGLQTATPDAGQPTPLSTPEKGSELPPFEYWTQPGDTLSALALRFGVSAEQISPLQPATGLLATGQLLTIPNLIGDAPYSSAAMPDSLVVYSPAVVAFDLSEYASQAGGFLATYSEQLDDGERLTGAQIVQRVALESSINPQLLLAIIEFRSGIVRGQPFDPSMVDYPVGFYVPDYKGLYLELSLVAKELNLGYYGWRDGSLTELVFSGNIHVRVSPGLNAGSVAVQNLTSKFYLHQQDWLEALYGKHGFLAIYASLFGDPWQVTANSEPLLPNGLAQPTLELPFYPGEPWALTAGPHIAWRTGTPTGALDFAPITGEPACAVSRAWVTASAAGLVVRSERGFVILDLDGDGLEQTGWELVFMHIADQDRIAAGSWVEANTPLGHPSCEGGKATGTHVHLARKYNGEWLAADGPIPMVLSGWTAHASDMPYKGTLEKDGRVVSAHPDGSSGSTIIR
jgi:LasA protease